MFAAFFLGVCSSPIQLGVANGRVQDSQITASSYTGNNLQAFHGRLNSGPIPKRSAGSWRADLKDSRPWIQVDFLRPVTVTGVLTHGREDKDQFVRKYDLKYSDDGMAWTKYHEVRIAVH